MATLAELDSSDPPRKRDLDGILGWLRTVFAASTSIIDTAYVNGDYFNAVVQKIRDSADAVTLQVKEVDSGDWNMDSTNQVSVAHGLTLSKIVSGFGYIRNDADNEHNFFGDIGASGANGVAFRPNGIDATNIILTRLTGGNYDGVNYNATSYSRGKIYVLHTP